MNFVLHQSCKLQRIFTGAEQTKTVATEQPSALQAPLVLLQISANYCKLPQFQCK